MLIKDQLEDDIKYNVEQLEAIRLITEFLDSDEKEFTLIGKAGTGKTTILKKIFNKKTGCLGVTLSHKARVVLSKSISNSHTIASALGMKMTYNEHGEVKFIVNKNYRGLPPITTAKYLIVDECSMISTYILEQIRENIRFDTKIIFVGDYHQLPPIDESRNPNEDSKVFYIKNTYELKDRVRQGDNNSIVELSDLIADQIETKHSHYFLKNIKSNFNLDNGKGYIVLRKADAVLNYIKNLQSNVDCKLIGYRNDTIKSYNKIIRDSIYNTEENIVVGDKLIAMDNHYIGKKLLFNNSDEFVVKEAPKTTFHGVECYMITCDKLYTSFFVPTNDGMLTYQRELDRLKTVALSDRFKWTYYFNYRDKFANVQHAYAINSHKSQGSTYNTVYVDLLDITSITMITNKEKLQSLYVAVTRPSDKLCIMV